MAVPFVRFRRADARCLDLALVASGVGCQLATKSTTRAMPVDFSSHRCQVTFANIDITDWKIAPIVNDQLRQVLKTIDANTPKLTNIRPSANQVWSSLQSPVEIAPRTWLVMEPTDVALGPITGSGLSVTSTLTLRARTRVIVGEKPPVTQKPLPALHVLPATAGGSYPVRRRAFLRRGQPRDDGEFREAQVRGSGRRFDSHRARS